MGEVGQIVHFSSEIIEPRMKGHFQVLKKGNVTLNVVYFPVAVIDKRRKNKRKEGKKGGEGRRETWRKGMKVDRHKRSKANSDKNYLRKKGLF